MEVKAEKIPRAALPDRPENSADHRGRPVRRKRQGRAGNRAGHGSAHQYLLEKEDIDLRLVELDGEAAEYLLTHFPGMQGRLYLADYLKLDMRLLFEGQYRVIGNLPYNISSQIFFKILDDRDRIPEGGVHDTEGKSPTA